MLAFDSFGKTLIYLGIILVIVGIVLHFGGKFFSLGRLPGDIHWEKGNFSFHFPIVTSLILSILLTVILNLFTRR
ncbi:DUF2905 domain-containing protein [Propionispora hippei]|uniref:DUF2905 domain-containing protein n=1 Tax=Propionispora hippei DSM 15287 TaxID=1123003 RepID=A0A1M6AHI1_9FIRM|nr:DUF2905 domain-containing protein [Propionispora hippei]SHI35902.1 Protein of unknown function [Propionispora hippei DSM 15287]